MIVCAPASRAAAIAASPTPPHPNTAIGVVAADVAGVRRRRRSPAITPQPSSPAASGVGPGVDLRRLARRDQRLLRERADTERGRERRAVGERHLLRRVVRREAVPRPSAPARPALAAHRAPVEDDEVAGRDAGDAGPDRVDDARGLVMTEYNVALVVASPFVAVFFFALFLALSRGIRRFYHLVAKLLARHFGRRAAAATGWVLVSVTVFFLVSGVLLDGLVSVMDEAFSVRNGITEEGVAQPATGLRSGGPGSLVPWDSLGREGRTFAGSGPAASDIATIVHHPAQEPIRIYAGLDSADDAEQRAALAVSDLQRAGGFQRANLLVLTTTGSGWVDPALVAPFEYLSGGDEATVAMQYSYLPSWLSFLVDQTKAREAGRALFDAVYDRWSKLPANQRPKLFVGGESLGTFGGETAFSGEYDLRNRTGGTVFAGPPNFNTLFREFSDHREPGSPEIQPVFKDGRTVRFATDAGSWYLRSVSPGRGPGSSTSCTRPIRSSGGPRTCSSPSPTGSARPRARTSSHRCSGCPW